MSLNISRKIRAIFVCGGTGGHIYPGVALAKEFMRRQNVDCLMVITSKTIDQYIMKKEGMPYQVLPVKGMNLDRSIEIFFDLYRFALSFLRAWQIVSSYAPDIIIGFGAYASFPVVLMGRIKGIMTFIHEQNLLPGKANLILGRWVDGIFTSFPQTRRFFPSQKIKMLGNPLRQVPSDIDKIEERKKLGLHSDRMTFLVFGGSRGAHVINMKAIEAFKIIKSQKISFQVIHQTGKEDFEEIARFYKREKIVAIAKPFIDHMMRIYGLADLAISRSGAGTISELTATGTPAILIPYPNAKADHQRINAMEMAKVGAARIVNEKNLTGRLLADEILKLILAPGYLQGMAQASLKLGRPNAAQEICDQIILWFNKRDRPDYAS